MQLQTSSYEVNLYLGSRSIDKMTVYDQDDVIRLIQEFHALASDKYTCAVRVIPLVVVAKTYVETGWKLVACEYPRFPLGRSVVWEQMKRLAHHLMEKMNQDRVSLSDNSQCVVLERQC